MPGSIRIARVHSAITNRRDRQCPGQKKTPAPEGPGSFAGWVRGWGLGGTPPGVPEQRASDRCVPASKIICEPKLFAHAVAVQRTPAARRASLGLIERQIELAAVGELQIGATRCAGGPGRRHGPRSHNACRPGIRLGNRSMLELRREPINPPGITAPRLNESMPDDVARSMTANRRTAQPVNHCGECPDRSGFERNQTPKPLSAASAFSDVSGRAPRWLITSAAASAPSRAQSR